MDGVDTGARKNGANALDPVPLLVSKFKSEFKQKSDFEATGPYLRMTPAEQKHLKSILIDDLLTPALEMKDDRIMNVRLALLKVLELMPTDVIQGAKCGDILQGLVEEMDTWESFDNNEEDPPFAPNNGARRSSATPAMDRPMKMSALEEASRRMIHPAGLPVECRRTRVALCPTTATMT